MSGALGVAYRYNDLEEPCNDPDIYPAVDKEKYSFEWSGPGTIGANYNATCNGEREDFPSRVQIDEAGFEEEGVYQIKRTHKKTSIIESKPYDIPVDIIDIAYEDLQVWSPIPEDENAWYDNCVFVVEATDLSTRQLEDENGNLLRNERKSGNGDFLKVVRNPPNTDGPNGTDEDGVLVEAVAVNNRTFALRYPKWSVEYTGSELPGNFEMPNDGETSFEIPVAPIPDILPSTTELEEYNVKAEVAIRDVDFDAMEQNMTVGVYNPNVVEATLDNGFVNAIDFVCDNMKKLKAVLKNFFGLKVDNCYEVNPHVKICFKCDVNQDQYYEKWEEVCNSPYIIRNKAGNIDFETSVSASYMTNICNVIPSLKVIEYIVSCDSLECLPKLKLQGEFGIDIPFSHDEKKYIDVTGKSDQYEFGIGNHPNAELNYPLDITFVIEGSCKLGTIVDYFIEKYPPPPGIPNLPPILDFTKIEIRYGGGVFYKSEIQIRPNVNHFRYEYDLIPKLYIKFFNKENGILIWERELPSEEFNFFPQESSWIEY